MRKVITAVVVVLALYFAVGAIGIVLMRYYLHMDVIRLAAKRYGFEPEEILAIVHTESGFDPNAESAKGAVGLMQVLPATARDIFPDSGIVREEMFGKDLNIELGARYLSMMRRRFNDNELALLAYHSGPTRVEKWVKETLPDRTFAEFPVASTRDYVKKVYENERFWYNAMLVWRIFFPLHNQFLEGRH